MTSPGDQHAATIAEIRQSVESGAHRAVVVDSPPGAGKSTLVVDLAARLTETAAVPIVAQTNAQADDLVSKLVDRHPNLTVGRLIGSTQPQVPASPQVIVSSSIADVLAADVLVATGAKWGYVENHHFPVGIVDEAYQMRSDQLLYVGDLFERALMVGDPGQLDPFTPADDSRWRGLSDGPVNPAVATVLHHHPDSPVFRLPVSWRLPASGAALVSDAFYPQMPFRAGSSPDDRTLEADTDGALEYGSVIDHAADSGWAFIELAERVCAATDTHAVDVVVAVVLDLLRSSLNAIDIDAGESGPVGPSRIAVGVVHRAQRSAIRLKLDEAGAAAGIDVAAVTVDTANRLQGREFHVTVVLHPLSGRAAASEFHLETGRLCVLLSRHRHSCIIVGRAGISALLDDHPISAPIWLGAPIPVPDGWEANQMVMERLVEHTTAIGEA